MAQKQQDPEDEIRLLVNEKVIALLKSDVKSTSREDLKDRISQVKVGMTYLRDLSSIRYLERKQMLEAAKLIAADPAELKRYIQVSMPKVVKVIEDKSGETDSAEPEEIREEDEDDREEELAEGQRKCLYCPAILEEDQGNICQECAAKLSRRIEERREKDKAQIGRPRRSPEPQRNPREQKPKLGRIVGSEGVTDV